MRKFAGALGIVALLALLNPVRAQDDAKLREVVDRAIKAHGGLETLTKYKASVSKEKGKFHGLGEAVDFSSVTSIQMPDRIRIEVKSKFGDQEFTFLQVIRGDKGWAKIGDMSMELDKDMLDEAKQQMNTANIANLAALKNKDYTLSPLGEAKVGETPVIGIRVKREKYRDVNLFFDKEKGFLLKTETRGKDFMRGGEEFTSTTLYDNYKKVQDQMIPHKVTIQRDGKPYVEGELIDVKNTEKLDDSVFEKP
jgi:hypothetical protein